MMSKSLVAYFSRRGKNYTNNGIAELKEGNTEIVAKKLAGLTGSDLFEIETVQPYPDDYQQTVAVSRQELADNARPQLKSQVANMAEYDVIYVGFPNWCGTMPMALFTFLGAMISVARRSHLSALMAAVVPAAPNTISKSFVRSRRSCQPCPSMATAQQTLMRKLQSGWLNGD